MSLQENLDHWRRRQIVTLDGESVVLRLGDSRIAAVLLPAMNRDDWRLLMTPAASRKRIFGGMRHIRDGRQRQRRQNEYPERLYQM